VSEQRLLIRTKNSSIEILAQEFLCIFLKARLLKQEDRLCLIVLISDESNNLINKIITYELFK